MREMNIKEVNLFFIIKIEKGKEKKLMFLSFYPQFFIIFPFLF